MKTTVVLTVGLLFIAATGCSTTAKFPSLTLGGAANKDAVLDMSLSKKGFGVTAPLVNVDVPFPSVKAEEANK